MTSDRFERLMSAIAFGEAGEHDTAREFLGKKGRMLLAVTDKAQSGGVFKYALNIGKRIKADIDVLFVSGSGASKPSELDGFLSEAKKEGISCSLVRTDGCMKKAILDYTEKSKGILFVIVGSTPELEAQCRQTEKALSESWKKLRCPLVVVSKDMPSFA